MPTVKFGFGSKAADAEASAPTFYDGPRPPKGLYRVTVKRLTMKKNKNDEYMLNCVAEISWPKGHKLAKYNGYGIWWNGNINEKGTGYINQFLDSISGGQRKVRVDFWGGKCRVAEGKLPQAVLAIGGFKIPEDGLIAYVSTRVNKPYGDNEAQLGVANWLLPPEKDAASHRDEDDEDDDVEDDDDIEVEDEDEDEDEADVDEDEDESSDDDDDDEPPF